MAEPLGIAWLTTGRGPGSYGALEYVLGSVRSGLPVEITVVFVNRDRGEAEATDRLIAMAESAGVAVETLSSVGFRRARGGKLSRPGEPLPAWRLEYDGAVAGLLARHEFTLGVMFGYMLIATPPLYERFRLLNDHPALPDGPIGTYQEVIHELIRGRAEESGCMVNMVTGDVDRGPAISFCRFAIRDDRNDALWRAHPRGLGREEEEASALYADVRARGVARERPFMAETLRALAEGRLAVPPPAPVDLTREVDAALAVQPGPQ